MSVDMIDALRRIATDASMSAADMAALARQALENHGIPLRPSDPPSAQELDEIANLPEMNYADPDAVSHILLPNGHKSEPPTAAEFRRLAKAKCAAVDAIEIEDDALVIPQMAGAVVAAWVHV